MENSELQAAIKNAFSEVVLGGGIGLHEADAIDSRGTPEICTLAREQDEKLDWQKVPLKSLNRCFSSYNWLDAEGLRFYLPAMMLAEVSGDYGHTVGDRLASPHLNERYNLLSAEQRQVVIDFLNWCLGYGEYGNSESQIIMTSLLHGHWRESDA